MSDQDIEKVLQLGVPLEFAKRLIDGNIVSKCCIGPTAKVAFSAFAHFAIWDLVNNTIEQFKKGQNHGVIEAFDFSRSCYLDACIYNRLIRDNPKAKRLIKLGNNEKDKKTMEVEPTGRRGESRKSKTVAAETIKKLQKLLPLDLYPHESKEKGDPDPDFELEEENDEEEEDEDCEDIDMSSEEDDEEMEPTKEDLDFVVDDDEIM